MPRPQDIFGQDDALAWLRRAYESDRLPHGLLFAGPAGVGKAATALALASVILCEQPRGFEPCGQCAACGLMDASEQDKPSKHPDCHIVTRQLIRFHDKTGESKAIDLAITVIQKELIEPANRKSILGRGKVFIVEEAERMNTSAQNALLKTLEEPAGRSFIILLTDESGALLPTIRSRCQLVRFGPLDANVVERELRKRDVSAAMAARAAELSAGSLGLAWRWIEDGVIERAGELHALLERLSAGGGADSWAEWFKSAAEAYAEKQLKRDELASKDAMTREGLALYLRLTAQYFRARLRQAADPSATERLCRGIDTVVEAETYLRSNVNIPLTFMNLSLQMERIWPAA